MNKLKEVPVEQNKKQAVKPASHRAFKRKRATMKFLKALNVFGLIEKDILVRIMPFVFFLTALLLLYIANGYYAEKTIREIDGASKEIKELRSEFISTKSELMFKSNQSQVAAAVAPAGLTESTVAPRKIATNSQPDKKKSD